MAPLCALVTLSLLLSSLSISLIHPSHAASLILSQQGPVTKTDGICWLALYERNFHDLCVASLNSDPRTKNSDEIFIPKISMEISVHNATAIRSEINNSLKTSTDSVTKLCLENCVNNYDKAISDIGSAIALYGNKTENLPFESIINQLDFARENVSDCEKGFRSHGLHLPLVNKIEISRKLIIVARALAMTYMK